MATHVLFLALYCNCSGLAATGNLSVAGTTFSYEYDPLTSSNVYSIQLFTESGEFSFASGEPVTRDFQKFVDFYGK